jgi:hypothetical protein
MKWKAEWWGITVIAENEDDNILIDKMTESLPVLPEETYDGGEIKIEINNGFKSIIFNR